MMEEGKIIKALSGFYYVDTGKAAPLVCRARGKFRKEKLTPLVGDRVYVTATEDGRGVLETLLPRRNVFVRPPVANIDCMLILGAGVNPVTDPFLIDRVTAIAARNDCEAVICISKSDLNTADSLYETYRKAGYPTIRTSIVSGEGIEALRSVIAGKVCAFVGNSGVGKSSLLTAMEPGFAIPTAPVSEKLGRGRHTTRHVELYPLSNGAFVADTPGFSSFDAERMELGPKEELQYLFPEFLPYLESCRFRNCAHISEKECGVLAALAAGKLSPSRHASYVRLYQQIKEQKEWEKKPLSR